MENPYAPSPSTNPVGTPEAQTPRNYGGIRRLPYWGILFGLVIAQYVPMFFVASWANNANNPSADAIAGLAPLGILVLVLILGTVAVYFRLKNIGMNPWLCLLKLVPIANLIVTARCLIFQEGYEQTKKLDTAGRIMTSILLVFVLLLFGSLTMYFLRR